MKEGEDKGVIRSMQLFQLLRYGGGFVAGIVLARLGIPLDQMGSFESLVYLTSLSSFFWLPALLNQGLVLLNLQDINSRPLFIAGLVRWVALFSFFASLLAVTGLAFFTDSPLRKVGLLPLFSYLFLNNLGFLNEHLLMVARRRMGLILYGISQLIVYVAAIFYSFYFANGLPDLVNLLMFIAVAKLVLLIGLLPRPALLFSQTPASGLLKQSLPVMLAILLSGSAEYIDGFLINRYLGPENFALFRYGAREFPLSLLLANALSIALVARFRLPLQEDTGGLELMRTETRKLILLIIPISIVLLFLSPIVYPLLFRPEFSASAGIFNLYLLLAISRLTFPQTLVNASGRTGLILQAALLEIILNISISLTLLPALGMKGVALGTLLAFAAEKAFLAIQLKRREGLNFSSYTDLSIWLTGSLLLLLSYFLVENFGK